MKIVGITDGVDSGKNRVLEILERKYDAQVIQADLVTRELMEPGDAGYEKLVTLCGDRILATDKTIDRPRMMVPMSHDDGMLQTVNGTICPLVQAPIHRQIEGSDSELVVAKTALPDENHHDTCIELWYAYTSKEDHMTRLLEGHGYSREKTRSTTDNQLLEEGSRKMADAVVDNSGPPEGTGWQVALPLK